MKLFLHKIIAIVALPSNEIIIIIEATVKPATNAALDLLAETVVVGWSDGKTVCVANSVFVCLMVGITEAKIIQNWH